MNIDIEELREDLQGKVVSIEIGDATNMILKRVIILPCDENSFSILNDEAVFDGNGDVIRINLKDIEMLNKYYENGIIYNIKCKRSGFYTVSVLDKVS